MGESDDESGSEAELKGKVETGVMFRERPTVSPRKSPARNSANHTASFGNVCSA